MEYLSKQRYDELAAELKYLVNEAYPKAAENLAEVLKSHDIPVYRHYCCVNSRKPG